MRAAQAALGLALLMALDSCSNSVQTAKSLVGPDDATASLTNSAFFTPLPADDPARGDFVPVHDPSITKRPDGTYIVYSTDLPFLNAKQSLAQRCSTDLVNWQACGYVFPAPPAWVEAQYPGAEGLWAPDISYFGALYRMYYAVSSLGAQHSAIGFATNATLDTKDPRYHWQDGGPVLQSKAGDDFNAIDPNVFVEPASGGGQGHVWLTYGSFWGGIFQQELDPATGKPIPGGKRYHLAQQPATLNGALEGAAIVAHNGWYYLFASVGVCCDIPIEQDTYQQIVGRSRSVHGPFVDENGAPMLKGAGTVLLTSDANWLAPGGGSLWQNPDGSETLLAFHALHRPENGALDLWVERVAWHNDWPVLVPVSDGATAAAVPAGRLAPGASVGALRASAAAF